MKKYAVLVAGGSGQRMGTDTPKQFLQLNGRALLQHTISAFTDTFGDIELIIVLPELYIETGKKLVEELNINQNFHCIAGGTTRFHSVKNGLSLVSKQSIVFVHDAVRCLVSPQLIKRCYEQALSKGSAIPAVTSTDSVRLVTAHGNQSVDRNLVKIIQTPQTFQSDILLNAFAQPYQDNFTDEATVVELYGKSVNLVEGEYSNIKITRPSDLLVAQQLINNITP